MTRASLAALLTAAAVGLIAAPAASACGPRVLATIEHGRSPGGQVWAIQLVATDRGRLSYGIYLPDSRGVDGGSVADMGVPPFDGWFFISANTGVGPSDEQEVDGVAARNVVKIDLTLADGRHMTILPKPAPRRVRHSYREARGVRFFIAWFPDGPQPVRAVASDALGRTLSSEATLDGGEFQPERATGGRVRPACL